MTCESAIIFLSQNLFLATVLILKVAIDDCEEINEKLVTEL